MEPSSIKAANRPVMIGISHYRNFCYLYGTMRRLAAFILLIPLGILFIGAVNLAAVCPVSQPDTCTQIPEQCCHQEKGACHQAKGSCPRDQKGDRSACCFDCPLCALITFPPFIHFEATRTEITFEYAVRPDNLLTDYYQDHWKPPNTSRLA